MNNLKSMQNGSAKEGSKIFNNSETRPFLMLFLEEKHLSMFGKHAQSSSFLVKGGKKSKQKESWNLWGCRFDVQQFQSHSDQPSDSGEMRNSTAIFKLAKPEIGVAHKKKILSIFTFESRGFIKWWKLQAHSTTANSIAMDLSLTLPRTLWAVYSCAASGGKISNSP